MKQKMSLILLLLLWNLKSFVEPDTLRTFERVTYDCQTLLKEFANHTAQFTLCSILHAHPIKFCEMCVNNYTNVQAAFENIMQLQDDKGVFCKSQLINVDRLAILENGHEYIQNLWLNGNCKSCFEIINGSMTDMLRNETKEFIDLHLQVHECILRHFSNGSYNTSVCEDCNNYYYNMNEFFEIIKHSQGEENICIDIIDSVNTTRAKWNELLHCGKKKIQYEIELVAVLLVASLLPIVFYISTKHFNSKAETRLSQQKRLVQTFSSSPAPSD